MKRLCALMMVAACALSGIATPATATPRSRDIPSSTTELAASSNGHAQIPKGQEDVLLAKGFATSDDRAWQTVSTPDGVAVISAKESASYLWETTAILSEPGIQTDGWVSNACAVDDRHLVVVYAPREFSSRADLAQRGAFVALVDLRTGRVTKLNLRSSIAYFSPSCGFGKALITQESNEDVNRTRLVVIDVEHPTTTQRIEVDGQLTSATPTRNGVVAADSGALVRVAPDGSRRVIASTTGVPFGVAEAADSSIVFMERHGDKVHLRSVDAGTMKAKARLRGQTRFLGQGPLDEVGLARAGGGLVLVSGPLTASGTLPAGIRKVPLAKDIRASTMGHLASELPVGSAKVQNALQLGAPVDVKVVSYLPATGRTFTFAIRTGRPPTNSGAAASPARGPSASPHRSLVAGTSEDPQDPDRVCAVPRSDPRNQAVQPKPRQVEWAVDQAVRGALLTERPADWKNLGMPAYTPQGLFPALSLAGGGSVPAQVYLGILAQESNLWQAARYAVPGVTGNPLVGNYYGIDYYNNTSDDDWTIDFSSADCGYGVSQLTDGMRRSGFERPGETALPPNSQRAVALDFAANVAAGLRVLQEKWNTTYSAGVRVNNFNASKIENWFVAAWAYNSGFYPESQAGSNDGAWGVGWYNNPVNPRYPANRAPFMEYTYADASHPQDWPYPEKVLGFAAHPIEGLESPGVTVAGYRAAWWNGGTVNGPKNREAVKPPVAQFCDASNSCDPSGSYPPSAPDVMGQPAGPCAHRNAAGQYDLKCWYHQTTLWKVDCNTTCGNELLRFSPGYAYQEDGTAYPPECSTFGLPASALIIDDIPDGVPSVRPNCPRTWTNAGSFALTFKPDASGHYPGKVDTHQLGGGFGGHFWFTHARPDGPLTVSASWRASTSHTGPMQVFVALPDHGAQVTSAEYVIKTARGDRVRNVSQPGAGNRWMSLGAYMFDGYPEVRLSSASVGGDGSKDVAFDAVAFVPIAGTYQEQSLEAVAQFDEDQDIDVASGVSSWVAGFVASRQSLYDWGLARSQGILGEPACAPGTSGRCAGDTVRRVAAAWRDTVQAAGSDPVNHPDGTSVGTWIGFAQKYTDRPLDASRPSWFDDSNRFKIKSKATASFVVDPAGFIVPGSEWVEYDHRTGNTHLPAFFLDLIDAIHQDYGIAPPDMSYQTRDLNQHSDQVVAVNPLSNGVLPGRAYAFMGQNGSLVDAAGNSSSSNAQCLATMFTSGGSIGYRPFLGAEDGEPVERFRSWVTMLEADQRVPASVSSTMRDMAETFFNPAAPPGGSVFGQAPPIWQELRAEFCAGGVVRPVDGQKLLRSSLMPDQYLYHDGAAVDLDGFARTSNSPIVRGQFGLFSQTPASTPNPFGSCGRDSGQGGNPWNMSPSPFRIADENPVVGHFCWDQDLVPDEQVSSP